MTTVHICKHHELVGLDYKLGGRRQAALDDAAEKAAQLLRSKGYNVDTSGSFTDWWRGGRIKAKCYRVFNWMAVEPDFDDQIVADMTEATKLFNRTLREWEADV